MNDKELAKTILELSGDQKNINSVTHCVTRLRLSVNDTSLVRSEEIKKLDDVLGVNIVGSQLQVVLGGKVHKIYDEFNNITQIDNNEKENNEKEKQNIINRFLDTVSGIFVPVIPAIIGAGLLKGILIFFTFYKIIPTSSIIYKLLNVFSDSAFYFIPILLAFSTALRFKCNPYVAAAIAGILLHPDLISLLENAGNLNILGFSLSNMNYANSVIPIILGIWIMSYIEKWLTHIIPKILKTILVPLLTLLIVAPIILLIVGPVGILIGNALGQGFVEFYLNYSVLAGIVLGGAYPFLILLGMHVGLTPVMLQSLSKYGVDYMMGIFVASNSAQAGATLAVFKRTKNKKFKGIAGTSGFNAILGVTEPALFGVTARLKKPLIAVGVGGAIGGGVAGLFKVSASGMGTGPIAGIPLFLGSTFVYFIISCVISFIIAYLLTLIIGFEDVEDNGKDQSKENKIQSPTHESVYAPMDGEIIPLTDVNDNVFSTEMMGQGVAILPKNGKVYAPYDGKVEMIFETKHAIGLRSESNTELLIHIGLNTVELKGAPFEVKVNTGSNIKKGDLLINFNLNNIKNSGYDVTTPIVITNSEDRNVSLISGGEINVGDEILEIKNNGGIENEQY